MGQLEARGPHGAPSLHCEKKKKKLALPFCQVRYIQQIYRPLLSCCSEKGLNMLCICLYMYQLY